MFVIKVAKDANNRSMFIIPSLPVLQVMVGMITWIGRSLQPSMWVIWNMRDNSVISMNYRDGSSNAQYFIKFIQIENHWNFMPGDASRWRLLRLWLAMDGSWNWCHWLDLPFLRQRRGQGKPDTCYTSIHVSAVVSWNADVEALKPLPKTKETTTGWDCERLWVPWPCGFKM